MIAERSARQTLLIVRVRRAARGPPPAVAAASRAWPKGSRGRRPARWRDLAAACRMPRARPRGSGPRSARRHPRFAPRRETDDGRVDLGRRPKGAGRRAQRELDVHGRVSPTARRRPCRRAARPPARPPRAGASAPSVDGRPAPPQRGQIGLPTLYGRLPTTSTRPPAGRRQRARSPSARVGVRTRPGHGEARRSARPDRRSTSSAMSRPARRASSSVSAPSPGADLHHEVARGRRTSSTMRARDAGGRGGSAGRGRGSAAGAAAGRADLGGARVPPRAHRRGRARAGRRGSGGPRASAPRSRRGRSCR